MALPSTDVGGRRTFVVNRPHGWTIGLLRQSQQVVAVEDCTNPPATGRVHRPRLILQWARPYQPGRGPSAASSSTTNLGRQGRNSSGNVDGRRALAPKFRRIPAYALRLLDHLAASHRVALRLADAILVGSARPEHRGGCRTCRILAQCGGGAGECVMPCDDDVALIPGNSVAGLLGGGQQKSGATYHGPSRCTNTISSVGSWGPPFCMYSASHSQPACETLHSLVVRSSLRILWPR